jgi:hypothetical protein
VEAKRNTLERWYQRPMTLLYIQSFRDLQLWGRHDLGTQTRFLCPPFMLKISADDRHTVSVSASWTLTTRNVREQSLSLMLNLRGA